MNYPDVSVLLAQGECDEQYDSAAATGSADGSWVLGVADGTSAAPGAARAATSVLPSPSKIQTRDEMLAVFAKANAAVRSIRDNRVVPRSEGQQPSTPYQTTMCVAAWTPESGLLVAWVGDSIPLLLPAGNGRCWVGRPMVMQGLHAVGSFAVRDDEHPAPSLSDGLYWLSDSMSDEELDRLTASGDTLVALVSDGACNAYRPWPLDPEHGGAIAAERGGWAGAQAGGGQTIWGLGVPRNRRGRARDASRWIVDEATKHRLRDNAAIAVARIPKQRSLDG